MDAQQWQIQELRCFLVPQYVVSSYAHKRALLHITLDLLIT